MIKSTNDYRRDPDLHELKVETVRVFWAPEWWRHPIRWWRTRKLRAAMRTPQTPESAAISRALERKVLVGDEESRP